MFFPPTQPCNGLKTLCEDVPHYPQEIVDRKLSEQPYLKLLLINEEVKKKK